MTNWNITAGRSEDAQILKTQSQGRIEVLVAAKETERIEE